MKRMALLFALAFAASCGGGSTPPPKESKTAPGGSKNPGNWPKDDRTMCDWRNKPELEVAETAGPGSFKPNVRRVYRTFGEGDARHKSLVCREIDTNLDGIKDVVQSADLLHHHFVNCKTTCRVNYEHIMIVLARVIECRDRNFLGCL